MPRRSVRRAPEGRVKVDIPADEVAVLSRLADDLGQLYESGLPDEVRHRLYPPAYDDAVKQAEYRRLMATDLAERKAADLATMRASLDRRRPLLLEGEEAQAWLGALQDMRLTLGTLLGIEEDGWEGDDSDDPQFAILHYLGFLQDSLVRVML